ncbi:MAG: hypothetical protein HC929_04705 [Leptolyngbyaceae cyanobacterium SM2_5_2]|nr:hypothetical protein [Leptolyngbyaceae cyanobacterium SM2_5_2]
MNNNRNTDKTAYIAALFAALVTAFLATVFFLVEASIQNAGLKEFIQGISGNIIATTLSFLIVYIFITSRGALGNQREEQRRVLDEVDIRASQLKAELFQGLDQIAVRLVREIDEKLSPDKSNSLGLRLDSFRAELLSEVRGMGAQIGNLVNSKLDLDSNDLYSFYGLKEVATGVNFQNFMVSRDTDNENVNAVSYLWADTLFGNTINAKIIGEMDPFLRIEFESLEPSWGCNITIRPQNERAVRLEGQGLNYLYFKARIPPQALQSLDLLKDVGIAIRIVNGKYQHWDYASRAGEYRQFPVHGDGTWTAIYVDLQDKRKWCHFESDGNQYISEEEICNANLSVIAGVVIKLGRFRPGIRGELGYGKGIIDIKDLRFSPNQAH